MIKNKQQFVSIINVFSVVLLLAFFVPVPADAGLSATYIYNLSNFTGTVPYGWVRPFVDDERNEVYVLTGDSVSIFNDSGMEVFHFGEDLEIGRFVDIAVEGDGRILMLTYVKDQFKITRCNYRGEPQSEIEIRNLPREFAKISPTRLISREGSLYLADPFTAKIVVADADGVFRKGYDVAPYLADFERKPGSENYISGFTVDNEGNMFFTVSAIFKAFRLSPDETLSAFGDSGNLPGKFNIVSGIATDDSGYIYVTDTLRSVVSVFDRNFKFQMQFSQRGLDSGSLIAPNELVVDKKGRVYVSQARKRGISVFQIQYD